MGPAGSPPVASTPTPAPSSDLVPAPSSGSLALMEWPATGQPARGRTAAVTDDEPIDTVETGSVAWWRARGSDRRRLLLSPRLRRTATTPAFRPENDAESADERDGAHAVAPFVAPASRRGRRSARRRLERRGFVPVSPGRTKLRHRILPRTAIGICTLLLAFGTGVGFSGAAFYAYYDRRLAENEETVSRFVDGFDRQFTDAVGTMDEMRVQAVGDIRKELQPLGGLAADANGVATLPTAAGPSVWQLETKDEAGHVMTGSAFAVAPHDNGTALVTSYTLVKASTTTPGPDIELVKRGQRIPAKLWTWDAEHDLALVVVDLAIPALSLASEADQVSAVGARLFAVGGVGGQGAAASPGVLLDHSQSGLQHTVPVGTFYQGGPLLNGAGRVIGMASLGYHPYGVDPGQVLQAPDVTALCARVVSCAQSGASLAVDATVGQSQTPSPNAAGTTPGDGTPAGANGTANGTADGSVGDVTPGAD